MVFAVGAALVVLFAGASLVLAVGESVPTQLWAAASALSGALVGILAPAPATKAAGRRHAAQQRSLAAAAAAQGAEARKDALAEAAAITDAAASAAGTVDVRAIALLAVGIVALALGIIMALGVGDHVAAQATQRDLAVKNVADTLIALGAAAAGAVVGLLAPPPGSAPAKS